MARLVYGAAFLCSLLGLVGHAADKDRVEVYGQHICSKLLVAQPQAEATAVFSNELWAIISKDDFIQVFRGLTAEFGSCISVAVKASNDGVGYELAFNTDRGIALQFALQVHPGDKRINMIHLTGHSDSKVRIGHLGDFSLELARLPGTISATWVDVGKKSRWQHGPQTPLAVASAFKLAVLARIVDKIREGRLTWDAMVTFNRKWAHPAGVLHDKNDGYEVSVKELARHMITSSDNTATDHLMHMLSRNDVEAFLDRLNVDARRNRPFLTTQEAFKLKLQKERRESYIGAPLAKKYAILDQLGSERALTVDDFKYYGSKPVAIDSIEWYFTGDELCTLMQWLQQNGDATSKDILAENVPFLERGLDGPWSYAAFKGGSEAGVLNLTYLLQTRNGAVGCFSLSWNNSADAVSLLKVQDLLTKTFPLLPDLLDKG